MGCRRMDYMARSTLKAIKYHPFELKNQWGITALHGVPVHINPDPLVCILLEDFKTTYALDVEDDEQGNFVGLGISNGKECFYWSDFNKIRYLQLKPFIAHNGISDVRKLQAWGFKIDESWLLWDTQLMGHILDSSLRTYGLKDMVKRELGFEYPSYESIVGPKTISKRHSAKQVFGTLGEFLYDKKVIKNEERKRKTLKDFPVEDVAEYNAADCYYTYKLYEKQRDQVNTGILGGEPLKKYFDQIEAPVSVVFKAMEERGIRLDVPYLTELETELSTQKAVLEKEIKNELGDINLNSPKQLLRALNDKAIYPEYKGKPSTDKRALERLQENGAGTIKTLLRYSEIDTLLNNFVTPYIERKTEIVNPNYLQTGTRTGRPSCSNPNLLQIPRKTNNGKLVRRMFIPREGCQFGELDYGQIEPRLLAHLSKDNALLEMFNDGTDFHDYTSKRLQIDREKAKVLNLSVGYRATFKSVSQQLKCTEVEAQKQIDAWWEAFPTLKAWQTKLIWQAKRDGYFTTLMGRRINVDNLNEYNKWKREAAERQLINNIAQASATEVMKMAMIQVHKHDIPILVQVYDSLLIEAPKEDIEEAIGMTKSLMENTTKLDVPLTVDYKIGSNWSFA